MTQRNRTMLNSVRDNDELPFLEDFVAVAELHQQPSPVDEKEFITLLMEMPPERPFELCEFDLHPIYLSRNLRS